MTKRLLIALTLACAPLAGVHAAPADVAVAVATPGRPEAAVALDEVRRPAEVLAWAGLKRGDRVLDYLTGMGYYAEIMARAVGPQGSVTGWNADGLSGNQQVTEALDGIRSRNPNARFAASSRADFAFPEGSFDFVLMHLVYHDAYWESSDFNLPRIDPAILPRALFTATSPGGAVVIIDHVATPGGDTRAVVEALHRIDPAVIRADFERAGFVFDGESDVLRVPEDDHMTNVFDPAIRGRTDRVVYRFRKPA